MVYSSNTTDTSSEMRFQQEETLSYCSMPITRLYKLLGYKDKSKAGFPPTCGSEKNSLIILSYTIIPLCPLNVHSCLDLSEGESVISAIKFQPLSFLYRSHNKKSSIQLFNDIQLYFFPCLWTYFVVLCIKTSSISILESSYTTISLSIWKNMLCNLLGGKVTVDNKF